MSENSLDSLGWGSLGCFRFDYSACPYYVTYYHTIIMYTIRYNLHSPRFKFTKLSPDSQLYH